MRLRDLLGDMSVPAKREPDYDQYIRLMETMRLNYARWQRHDYVYDPRSRHYALPPKGHPGPMPIDLKAYVVAREYDPDKHSFGRTIDELVKHKNELHPHMRRYLLDQLRTKQNRHRKLAESYQAVADQFEIEATSENGI
jgi:myo-inositol-1-phosphate synthase